MLTPPQGVFMYFIFPRIFVEKIFVSSSDISEDVEIIILSKPEVSVSGRDCLVISKSPVCQFSGTVSKSDVGRKRIVAHKFADSILVPEKLSLLIYIKVVFSSSKTVFSDVFIVFSGRC